MKERLCQFVYLNGNVKGFDTMLWFLKEAQEYAEKNSMFFIETSAKTADNINQLFEVCNYVSGSIVIIYFDTLPPFLSMTY